MEGYIKIHRQIEENKLWLLEPFTRGQAWIDLILLANFKPSVFSIRGIIINLDRGQLAWSEEALARRWKWSRDKLRRFLKTLKTEQQIVQQKTAAVSVITIVNYGKYQETIQQTIQQKDNRKTHPKNVKKEKKYNTSSNDEGFDAIWNAYWRKVGKGAGVKAWNKLTNEEQEKVLPAIERQRAAMLAKEPQYRPHISTWLNQRRWLDESDPIDLKFYGKLPGEDTTTALQRMSKQGLDMHKFLAVLNK